jgi:predicted ester cyclase
MISIQDQNRQMVARLFDEVWNQANAAAADTFYAPGDHLEGIKRFHQGWYAAFPDWQVTVRDTVAEGDKIAVYWTGEGAQEGPWQGRAGTGRRGRVDGIDFLTVHGGKIVREDSVVDLSGLTAEEVGHGS